MKYLTAVTSLFLITGCASTNNGYQQYLDQSSKIQQSINASEAACLLVLAEAVKSADNVVKAAIFTQIDRCKKEPPRIDPPPRRLLDFFN